LAEDIGIDRALEKTNRMNLLLDLYEPLLTEKQRTFLKHYIHEDYTLGEIAELFEISRQAVFEHIKRAEAALEEYEGKLGLLLKHEKRVGVLDELERIAAEDTPLDRNEMLELIRCMKQLD
jgi:uncharacterized protein